MRKLDSRAFRLGFATLVLFTGLAGDFWRNLLSWYGFGAVVLLILSGSIVLLVRGRGAVRLSRMPYPLTVRTGSARRGSRNDASRALLRTSVAGCSDLSRPPSFVYLPLQFTTSLLSARLPLRECRRFRNCRSAPG